MAHEQEAEKSHSIRPSSGPLSASLASAAAQARLSLPDLIDDLSPYAESAC